MITLRRGVNLSHWFSQSDRRGAERAAWIGPRDLDLVKSLGFDHVRLPLDEEQLWHEDGSRDTQAWELLEQALGWIAERDLKVACDLHILRSHYFNQADEPALYREESALESFKALWRDLGVFLGRFPTDFMVLEILNEAVARDSRDWNRVLSAVFATMRTVAPRHTIITGSNWYCMCKTFGELEVPDDPNQILTFHFYNPMCVTHHKAHWAEIGAWQGGVSYPFPWPEGIPADVQEPLRSRMERENILWGPHAVRDEIALPIQRARETGLPLYCGEFGVINLTPLDIRKAWLRDTVATFEESDIGWALWDWKGDFGVVDRDMRLTGIHEALFPKA
jgi:endoglucanase